MSVDLVLQENLVLMLLDHKKVDYLFIYNYSTISMKILINSYCANKQKKPVLVFVLMWFNKFFINKNCISQYIKRTIILSK